MFQFSVSVTFERLRSTALALMAGLLLMPVSHTVAEDGPAADEGTGGSAGTDSSVLQDGAATDEKKTAPPPAEPRPTDLLEDNLEKQWEHFSSKAGISLGDVWKVNGEGADRVVERHFALPCLNAGDTRDHGLQQAGHLQHC